MAVHAKKEDFRLALVTGSALVYAKAFGCAIATELVSDDAAKTIAESATRGYLDLMSSDVLGPSD
jgi:hypothetical protein